MGKRKAPSKKAAPAPIDTRLYAAIEKLQTLSANLSGLKVPENQVALLEEAIGMLETSNTALLEDSYDYCCELIDPYVKPDSNGCASVTEASLTNSVGESLGYLIEFWQKNKDKPGIDHCL